jgi:hypothetical protein
MRESMERLIYECAIRKTVLLADQNCVSQTGELHLPAEILPISFFSSQNSLGNVNIFLAAKVIRDNP